MNITTDQNATEPKGPQPTVIVASRPAGVVTKTVPTSTISTSEKRRVACRTPLPSSSPTISGRLMPSLRMDIMPER